MTEPTPRDTATTRRLLRRATWLGWALVLAAVVVVFTWRGAREDLLDEAPSSSSSSTATATSEELPVLAEVPAFDLVDQDGEPVDREALLGRPWVADFIFTSCPGICPTLTRRMAELAGDVPAEVRLVSISVDPENDTPEVLRAYAETHGAGENWRFLTGPIEAIYSLIRDGFLLPVEPAGEGADEPIVHTNRFVLVDSQGQIRGYYNAFDAEALEQLRVDIERLVG